MVIDEAQVLNEEYKFPEFQQSQIWSVSRFSLKVVCFGGYAWPGFLSHEQSHITSAGDDELRA